MRHLVGFFLALVLAAALFFGAGWGVERIIALRGAVTNAGAEHALTSPAGLFAVGVVAAVGLFTGILLAAPRVSPLAAGLPGLVLVGWSVLMVLHSNFTLRYLPLAGSQFANGITYLLFNGMLGMLGVAMLIPLGVPSRWRRAIEYEEDDVEDDYDVQRTLGLVP